MGAFPYDGGMEKKVILSIAVPGRFLEGLDYLPPLEVSSAALVPGVRLEVPLGRRRLVGVLLALKQETRIEQSKLRRAYSCLDQEPILPAELLQLLQWTSQYYRYPIGDTIMTALPKGLRQGKVLNVPEFDSVTPQLKAQHNLTEEQREAVDRIHSAVGFQVYLLDGVTGSGKTEVYMQIAERVLQQGKQVLVLVPEIGLTPQMMRRFEQRFNVPVLPLHSAVADGRRLKHWMSTKSAQPLLVIGTRLAVFAPFAHLALVIIDEEHDLSFKQQSGLRYSARDVAIKRCADLGIPIVLGSATPSFESILNIERRGFQHLRLTTRVANAVLPAVSLIDLRNQRLRGGLSQELIDKISLHIGRGQQVLLFLNRRGYAPVLLCRHCGWTVECENCDALMVWHKQAQKLSCHHCGRQAPNPEICQQCQQSEVEPIGTGTQRLDETLRELFPAVPILRIDKDSTRKKNSLTDMIKQIESGEPMILVGTQMVAKGHHFPGLSLVAMVDADGGLFSIDFRAQERLAQQIIQVSGRAGRGMQLGEVILQTHHPEHPLILQLLSHGYKGYADIALAERQRINQPPHCYWAMLHAEAKDQSDAMQFIQQCIAPLQSYQGAVEMMGPVLAPMAKRKGYYRAQLILSSPKRSSLNQILSFLSDRDAPATLLRRVRWSIDVDPQEFI